MKKTFLLLSFACLVSGSALAQSSATATAPPGGSTKTSVHAVCKDGTPYSGTTLRGACRGHGGVDKNAPSSSASASTSKGGESSASSKGESTTSSVAQTTGGGAGKVWGNDASKVYHCQGDRFYGKTKHGEYMTEADAKAKGFRAARGKACSS